MKTILRIILPIILLGVAAQIAVVMVKSRKPLPPQNPEVALAELTVSDVNPELHSPPIESYGNIRSYFETRLTSQVSGMLINVSPEFRVGSHVKKGTILAEIDPTDYHAALTREKATYSGYQSTYAEETITSEQAREDWLASGRSLTTASPFVLRTPQLNAAKANMEASQAAIQKAEADLERCKIRAPFDAVISDRSASLGSYTSAQSNLGTLISTEIVSVRLPLTPKQISRIALPSNDEQGINITLTSPVQPGAKWPARIVRTVPSVDANNQVTYAIAEINDPYDSETPLAVGTFVTASIPATPIGHSIKVPEAALVRDAYIWLVDQHNHLVKAPVKRIASHEGSTFLQITETSLQPPYRVVQRPLTNFRNGTAVKVTN
ncbi:efflux RND transporter periplasmic adaptor subunit [Rubritalea marina]|uniref:efflux RND transporter periplasmic adaptor subunit n=1 Tax=Rubritalea marina TaxID=361055 RepID=UPI000367D820|nr:efflux RND transporter periplasmic adaptor subunit [Rubritalea marina]